MFVLKASFTTNTPWIYDQFRKFKKIFSVLKPLSRFYGIFW